MTIIIDTQTIVFTLTDRVSRRPISGLSEVRPDENVSLIEVNLRNELVQSVNKEIKDISGTKEKKKSLLKEVCWCCSSVP